MKKTVNFLFVVAVLLLVVGGFFALRAMNEGDEEKAEKAAPAAPVEFMSTDGVVDNIERRLTQNEGRAMRASCPDKVEQTIGTRFQCDVFFEGRDDAVAVADVEIDGPGGEFSWKSRAKVQSSPTPDS
jgi:hypothetical protein